MLLDRYLGSYDVRAHYEVALAADAESAYRAARELDLGRSLPVMALFAVRGLPHMLTGKVRPSRSLTLDRVLELGFVVLAEDPPNEFVIGAVGRFWRPDSGLEPITASDFSSFDRPGFAKGALNFTVEPQGSGGSLVATETRVACTDEASRRKFMLYWRAIAPFSGYIRRVMLAEIRRSAETTVSR